MLGTTPLRRSVLVASVYALVTSLALMTTPALAQSDLEQRVERIEQRLNGSALMGLMNQAETLRGEVTTLRGEIEVLQRQIDDLRDQQRQIYLDLDERLLGLEANPSADTGISQDSTPEVDASSAAGETASTGGSAQNDSQAAYDAAFSTLREGDYAAAASAFEQFLTDYPNAELAANARYWLGESYYVVRSFSQALTHFQAVIDNHPDSNKRPDALLKIGFVHFEQGRNDAARSALERVVDEHPDSTAANLASQRLDQL